VVFFLGTLGSPYAANIHPASKVVGLKDQLFPRWGNRCDPIAWLVRGVGSTRQILGDSCFWLGTRPVLRVEVKIPWWLYLTYPTTVQLLFRLQKFATLMLSWHVDKIWAVRYEKCERAVVEEKNVAGRCTCCVVYARGCAFPHPPPSPYGFLNA
jgi:hypothetical protein